MQLDINIPNIFKNDVTIATKILQDAGCKEIYLFGSLVEGNYADHSDIDIAVRGLDEEKYFLVSSKIMRSIKHDFDLIDLDEENNNFNKFLEINTRLVRVN